MSLSTRTDMAHEDNSADSHALPLLWGGAQVAMQD